MGNLPSKIVPVFPTQKIRVDPPVDGKSWKWVHLAPTLPFSLEDLQQFKNGDHLYAVFRGWENPPVARLIQRNPGQWSLEFPLEHTWKPPGTFPCPKEQLPWTPGLSNAFAFEMIPLLWILLPLNKITEGCKVVGRSDLLRGPRLMTVQTMDSGGILVEGSSQHWEENQLTPVFQTSIGHHG